MASALQLRRTGNLATFANKVAKLPVGQSLRPVTNWLRRSAQQRRYPQKVAKLPVASGGPLAREGCHGWPSSAAQRNPMRLATFGIQLTEINPPSPRLVQSDLLRKEFARFFNFAVVRHHIGGRTTRTWVQVTFRSLPSAKGGTFALETGRTLAWRAALSRNGGERHSVR